MLGLLLALLFSLGTMAPAAPQAAAGIECATCKGKGHALQECLACEGAKQIACPSCQAFSWAGLTRELASERSTSLAEADIAKLLESFRVLRTTRRELLGEQAPGAAPCPATCSKGRSLLNRGLPCKYCDAKGNLPCRACQKKGVQRCATCEGRGRVERACEDCLGTGRRPDPAGIAPQQRGACPACSGKGSWACAECDEHGFADAACRACNGEGRVPCPKCLGTRQKPCAKCSATGDLSSYLAAKSGNRCDACNAKGRVACDACETGSVACGACKGKGHMPQRCLACGVSRVRPCIGCAGGSFRAWELAGSTLLAAGDAEGARAFYEIARSRIDGRIERLASLAEDPKAAAKALDKERKVQCERLDKAIAATRTAPK